MSPHGAFASSTAVHFAGIRRASFDRLGRSLQDLVGFLSELHALKIDLFLRQQGLDTTTPADKAMFQMMGVFAEFERAMIAERVRAGLARVVAGLVGDTVAGSPVDTVAGSVWRSLTFWINGMKPRG
jgi:hypothetical protein